MADPALNTSGDPTANLDNPPVLRRVRMRTLVLLRWFAVIGQTATVLIVRFGFGFDVDLVIPLTVISASVWFNIVLAVLQPTNRLLSNTEATAQLLFDVVQLTALITFTGGLANPFVVLLGAPVVIASSALRGRSAIVIGIVSLACTGVMALWSLPLPWRMGVPFEPPTMYVAGLWTALVTSASFMSVFAWRAASDARRMSAAAAATEAILARQQRLTALGGLAAAAAHELGTPLGTIQVVAKEIYRNAPLDSELSDDANLLMSQATRCRDILKQLSRRGAEDDAVHAQLSLAALLDEACDPSRGLGKEIAIVMEGPNGEDNARPPQLRRLPEMIYAVGNYVQNAVEFATSQAIVTGRWTDEWIEVEVRDDGRGFPPDILGQLGEPYVSRRDADASPRGGLGLGFFIAKTFVERLGGDVNFTNLRAPAHGAIVRARWPFDRIKAPDR